jgi:ABC-2 type transport system permease protein
MSTHLLAIWSLWKRELVRFYRQRNRVIGALGPPLLVWFFIGSGFRGSFHPPGVENGISYLEYFYPGVITLVVLFTAIFSSISIIEDRRDGFLYGVLVSPVSRPAIVLGKMLGGASQAFFQAALLLVVLPFIGIGTSGAHALVVLGTLGLISLSVTALGFATAWGTDSTQGYHAIMNLLLMPMWVLSGAFFPLTGAPVWLRFVMRLNPMTYALAALRGSFYGEDAALALTQIPMLTACIVVAGFGALMFGTAVWVAHRAKA